MSLFLLATNAAHGAKVTSTEGVTITAEVASFENGRFTLVKGDITRSVPATRIKRIQFEDAHKEIPIEIKQEEKPPFEITSIHLGWEQNKFHSGGYAKISIKSSLSGVIELPAVKINYQTQDARKSTQNMIANIPALKTYINESYTYNAPVLELATTIKNGKPRDLKKIIKATVELIYEGKVIDSKEYKSPGLLYVSATR
jgi:hypothetical protein